MPVVSIKHCATAKSAQACGDEGLRDLKRHTDSAGATGYGADGDRPDPVDFGADVRLGVEGGVPMRRRRGSLRPGWPRSRCRTASEPGAAVDWHHTKATTAASPIKHHDADTAARHHTHLRVCASADMFGRVGTPAGLGRGRTERYAAVGRALADPKRLCVLETLAIGELSVGDLRARVGCQVPNMSQHLAVLRSAGLVISRAKARPFFTASRTRGSSRHID